MLIFIYDRYLSLTVLVCTGEDKEVVWGGDLEMGCQRRFLWDLPNAL